MSRIFALFAREWRVARAIGGGGAMAAVFFLILVSLTPFAIGPDLNLLSRVGPAILWIAALLSSLLGLDRLFQADGEDGSLDQFMLSSLPLELLVLVKCAAHWALSSLPLVVLAPVLGLSFGMEGEALAGVSASLLAGTPALTLLGAIGAGLTVGLRRGGLLMAVIILPLTAPTLIFGVASAAAASGGTVPFHTPFLILCGLSLLALAGAPFAAAAALRAREG